MDGKMNSWMEYNESCMLSGVKVGGVLTRVSGKSCGNSENTKTSMQPHRKLPKIVVFSQPAIFGHSIRLIT